jgi:hypothetical protein
MAQIKQWIALGEKLGYIKEGKFLGMFGDERTRWHGFGQRGRNFEEMTEYHKDDMEEHGITKPMLAQLQILSKKYDKSLYSLIAHMRDTATKWEDSGEMQEKDPKHPWMDAQPVRREVEVGDETRLRELEQKLEEQKESGEGIDAFMETYEIKDRDVANTIKRGIESGEFEKGRRGQLTGAARYVVRWNERFNMRPYDAVSLIEKANENNLELRDVEKRLEVMNNEGSIESGSDLVSSIFSPAFGH